MTEPEKKLELPTYDEALARVLAFAPLLPSEHVALMEANGRVLQEALCADRDQPPFNRSAMDGFAIRSSEFVAKKQYTVTGSVAAGQRGWESLADRADVIRIATGAPVPVSFDAVIPIEQANVIGDVLKSPGGTGVSPVVGQQDRRDACPTSSEKVVFTVDAAKPWQNVHRRAADAEAGHSVIKAGTKLGPAHIGIGAAVGASEVVVSALPRITLLTSGDEVKPFDTATAALESQQIRNSNGPMLAAFFQSLGTPLLQHVHVPDEPEETLAAAREALSHSHLVITVGGVSAGQRDLLPWAWQKLGLDVILHGVAIQPGKPLFVAGPRPETESSESALNAGEGGGTGQGKLVIGLPGNPVSVLATAHLFVWPVIGRMLGMEDSLPWRSVQLTEPMRGRTARQLFRSVQLDEQGDVAPVTWHGSGDLMHTAAAKGWVRLPQSDGEVAKGERLPFLPLLD